MDIVEMVFPFWLGFMVLIGVGLIVMKIILHKRDKAQRLAFEEKQKLEAVQTKGETGGENACGG